MIDKMRWKPSKKERVRKVLRDKAYCSSEDTDNEDIGGPFGKSPNGRKVRKRICKKLRFESARLTRTKDALDRALTKKREPNQNNGRAPVRKSRELSKRSIPKDAPAWARGEVAESGLLAQQSDSSERDSQETVEIETVGMGNTGEEQHCEL